MTTPKRLLWEVLAVWLVLLAAFLTLRAVPPARGPAVKPTGCDCGRVCPCEPPCRCDKPCCRE